jgi:hypothetical protein
VFASPLAASAGFVDDYFICNRIKSRGTQIVFKHAGAEAREEPSLNSKTLYVYGNTERQDSLSNDKFYLVGHLNLKDRLTNNEYAKNESPPGWSKIAYGEKTGFVIGWVRNDDIETKEAFERRKKEQEEKEEREALIAAQMSFREIRAAHKGFKFRDILIGVRLDKQMFSCDVNETGLCYRENKYVDLIQIEKLADLGFIADTQVRLVDGSVENIFISLSSDNASEMLSLLKKKYGKPASFKTDVVQNRMNAKFSRFTARWRIKNCDIYLTNIGYRVDGGFLSIDSMKYKKQSQAEQQQKTKKALDNL